MKFEILDLIITVNRYFKSYFILILVKKNLQNLAFGGFLIVIMLFIKIRSATKLQDCLFLEFLFLLSVLQHK